MLKLNSSIQGHHMITFASAECFTHCEVARQLHLLSAPYSIQRLKLRVAASCFLPSVESVAKLLSVKLPSPKYLFEGIKVYDEDGDREVVLRVSRAVLEKLGVDMALSSSAGIGGGYVAIRFRGKVFLFKSGVSLNLLKASENDVLIRQASAVTRAVSVVKNLMDEKKLPSFVEVLNG